jgi:uncharacterized radical SAM superfamily protein
MDIENKNGEIIISSFNGRVAKHFKETNQLLITFNRKKQTDSDIEKLNNILSDEVEFDMNNGEFVISDSYADHESGGGVLYTVNAVESLSERDINGGFMSDTEILLFNVTNVEKWSS